jgi:UDP-glucose 4-epimerase
LAYWKEKKLPVVIVRLFNTVGRRQTGRYGMVVPTFVHQALTGDPITVYGDGTQSRCFTHVSDTVDALIRLAQNPAAVGDVFNIGGTEEITISKLACLVKDLARSTSEIRYVPYGKAYEEGFEDLRRRVPDLTKITRLVDFRPTRGIKEIVQDLIDYLREGCSSDDLPVEARKQPAGPPFPER